jgi:hypothetical protein
LGGLFDDGRVDRFVADFVYDLIQFVLFLDLSPKYERTSF